MTIYVYTFLIKKTKNLHTMTTTNFSLLETNNLLLPILVGVIGLGFLILIIYLIRSNISHTCEKCHKNKTTNKNDDGKYQCEECTNSLLIMNAKKNEKIRVCPDCRINDCRINMDKQVIDGTAIVADVCPNCGGIFLDKGKIEELEDQLGIDKITCNPATTVVMMSNILH